MVDGQKMSKSLGNYYTLRNVLERGYAAEAIRYLLASVPYRKSLNFTFDGLKSAATAIDRLRNFKLRLETDHFAEARRPADAGTHRGGRAGLRRRLTDDLTRLKRWRRFSSTSATPTAPWIRRVPRRQRGGRAGISGTLRWRIRRARTRRAGSSLADAEVEALIAERASAKKSRVSRAPTRL